MACEKRPTPRWPAVCLYHWQEAAGPLSLILRNILAICRKNGRPPLAVTNLYWIPAFTGMTTGCCTWPKCYDPAQKSYGDITALSSDIRNRFGISALKPTGVMATNKGAIINLYKTTTYGSD